MEYLGIGLAVYVLVGFFYAAVLAWRPKTDRDGLGELLLLVVAAWPFFLIMGTLERSARPGDAEPQPARPSGLAGRRGKAIGDLRPRGMVDVNGKTYAAVAIEGFVAGGRAVEIVEQAKGELRVRAVGEAPPAS